MTDMANFLLSAAIEAWGWRIPFLRGGLFGLFWWAFGQSSPSRSTA